MSTRSRKATRRTTTPLASAVVYTVHVGEYPPDYFASERKALAWAKVNDHDECETGDPRPVWVEKVTVPNTSSRRAAIVWLVVGLRTASATERISESVAARIEREEP